MSDILPLISVVIPSYNHAAYVGEAIRSVSEQVREGFVLEIIVIDDGSTDGSAELLMNLQKQGTADFKLVLKSNEGLCRTLNRAILEHSTGDFVAVIASDDMWHPRKLSKQLKMLYDNPHCALCYSNARTFGENRRSGWSSTFLFSGNIKNLLTIYNFVPAGTMFFKRQLYDAVGGFDETGLKLEDWDFLLRASAHTKFCYINEGLLLYRVHGESSLTKMRANGTLFVEKMKVLQKNKDMTNPILRAISTCLHFGLDRVMRPTLSKIEIN